MRIIKWKTYRTTGYLLYLICVIIFPFPRYHNSFDFPFRVEPPTNKNKYMPTYSCLNMEGIPPWDLYHFFSVKRDFYGFLRPKMRSNIDRDKFGVILFEKRVQPKLKLRETQKQEVYYIWEEKRREDFFQMKWSFLFFKSNKKPNTIQF